MIKKCQLKCCLQKNVYLKANFVEFRGKKTKRQSFRRESGPQGPNHPRSKLLNNAKIVTAHTVNSRNILTNQKDQKHKIKYKNQQGMVQGKDNKQ